MRRWTGVPVLLLSLWLTHAAVAHTPQATTGATKHCYQGCPKLAAASRRGGDVIEIRRGAYTLQVSTVTKAPFWVAEIVTAQEVSGDATRSGYRADPALRDEPHATLADYRDADVKYDIGHQAAAANHKRNQNRMDQTFFLSNMAPQIPAFNRGIWRTLELNTRKWIQARGRAWCLTGPIFSTTPKTIGDNKVAVPEQFYKIIVAPNPVTKQVESIAFVFPNKSFTAPFDFKARLVSISEIEKLTGINFMPELTPSERTRLETKAAPAVW